MKKNFVCFLSPGTFFNEETHKPIDNWNIDLAKDMAKSVKERHGAKPYAFYFYTKGRNDNELDSKIINKSPMYFLGGKVQTLEELIDKNDSNDRILISNMKNNNVNRVLVNTNSWKITVPLSEDSIVLEWPI